MKKQVKILILSFLVLFTSLQAQNHKYELWQEASFFRGFNILTNQNFKLKDITDLKASGANLVQIGIDGFYDVDSPYKLNQKSINTCDSLVAYCDSVRIYYTITVRSGPGRRDVYLESECGKPKSTIWKNRSEQMLYGSMLRGITDRYKDDSLFAGIGLMVEPNPLFDSLQINALTLRHNLSNNSIDYQFIVQTLIDSVRNGDKKIPILIQNYQYSCPEFFSITDCYPDKYYIFEFHSYRPLGYVKNTIANSGTYPGLFLNVNDLAFKYFDKNFFLSTVFRSVDSISKVTGKPIYLGEFGLMLEQIGGTKFLTDMYEICIEKGWHFALWDYRSGRDYGAWDYEKKSTGYWQTVLKMFIRTIISVPDITEDSQHFLKIYPTLASDYINIECNTVPNSLNIFSLSGLEVADLTQTIIYHNNILVYNLQQLPNGIYFVQMVCKSGTIVRSFVVSR